MAASTFAFSGFNGQNQTYVTESTTIGLNFYNGTTCSKFAITDTSVPLVSKISRNPTAEIPAFTDVNITSVNENYITSSTHRILPQNATLKAYNASLFLQLRPNSTTVGYFMWVKLGSMPYFNSSNSDYDFSRGFCPNTGKINSYQVYKIKFSFFNTFISKDLKTQYNDTFYQMALNSTQVNGFRGFVGFGIREMNTDEYSFYCQNNINITRVPRVYSWVNFTQNFSIRIFSAGCYWYDVSSGSWSSEGVYLDVLQSNLTVTVCKRYLMK